jgi:hypothetical protein
MAERHIAELLIEVNKHISEMITNMESGHLQDKKMIVDRVNDAIRQLDNIVEHLERR